MMNQLLQKFKGHILTALVAIVIGVILGFIFDKPKTEFLAGETITITKDTCIGSTLLCTLTTKDSLSIYRYIREGFKSKSEKIITKTESVVDAKPEEIPTVIKKQVKTKYMNNGVTEVWDTLTFIGELVDWKRATQLNEVVEVQEKTTTTTAVVEAGKDDSNTTKTIYLPVETTPKKQTWVSLGGSMNMNPKNQLGYDFGLGITSGKLNVSLFKDPTTDFNALDGYRLGLNFNTLRLSKK